MKYQLLEQTGLWPIFIGKEYKIIALVKFTFFYLQLNSKVTIFKINDLKPEWVKPDPLPPSPKSNLKQVQDLIHFIFNKALWDITGNSNWQNNKY